MEVQIGELREAANLSRQRAGELIGVEPQRSELRVLEDLGRYGAIEALAGEDQLHKRKEQSEPPVTMKPALVAVGMLNARHCTESVCPAIVCSGVSSAPTS